MKENRQIKDEALVLFRSNYWLCVVVVFVAMAIDGVCSALGARHHAAAFSGLLGLVVSGPVLIGLNWFFVQLQRNRPADMDTMFVKGFGENLGRHVGGYLLTALFTFLWSLLFFVPGIIKALSYSLTTYLLADRPELTAQEALIESMRMMEGKKGKLFCLFLRFLGWLILSGLTGGILYVFYVGPWINTAMAGFYEEVKAADMRGYVNY